MKEDLSRLKSSVKNFLIDSNFSKVEELLLKEVIESAEIVLFDAFIVEGKRVVVIIP
tara:strand:+ start:620 stop:790 length:171 start_codon:yes stop_codon:yes gene_type:complete